MTRAKGRAVAKQQAAGNIWYAINYKGEITVVSKRKRNLLAELERFATRWADGDGVVRVYDKGFRTPQGGRERIHFTDHLPTANAISESHKREIAERRAFDQRIAEGQRRVQEAKAKGEQPSQADMAMSWGVLR